MSKLSLVFLGIIVVLVGLMILAELLKALLGAVLFISFFVIVVGGAFLILRQIFN